MSHPALAPHPVTRIAVTHAGWLLPLLIVAGLMFAAATLVSDRALSLVLITAGGTLASLALFITILSRRHASAQVELGLAIATFIENDAAPSFTTDADGAILTRNVAAETRFGESCQREKTLARCLRVLVANPSGVLARLHGGAAVNGSAREDIVTRQGHARLSVHQVGRDRLLWRLEDLSTAPGDMSSEPLGLPMLTLGAGGSIRSVNEPLRALAGGVPASLDRLFTELPPVADKVMEIQTSDGAQPVRVIEQPRPGGGRDLYLVPVEPSTTVESTSVAEAEQFDNLPVALLLLTREGRLRRANRQARELLGQAAEPETELQNIVEGLGRSIKDWLEEAVAGRGLGRPEFVRAHVGDKELYLQFTLGRVMVGGIVHLVAVLNDATELKTLEAQFVQSQKMQAIGQLAGGVAHDFNNLLTAISGHCDLLLLRHDQGDPDYGDLVQINQNANRAASLVGQLLAFSRKQNLQPEVLDLRDTLSDLTHLLNRLVGEKVQLTLTHDPGLRPIRADKRQLEQVLMNLVVNARDAMPEGGEIKIETEGLRIAEPLVRDRATVAAGDYAIVRVTDQGYGIAPDKLAKIFEPFFTTKRTGEGTGLGLSTAYGIIKQTGGYIFVDSVVGSGTTFSLYFPAHDRPAEVVKEAVAPVTSTAFQQGEGVILLVEDEAPVRAFASRALRMRGYTVLEAECAEDALETLEDEELLVDVFVTDVVMPGMDGPTWVRQALLSRPGVHVVFVSGYAEENFSDEKTRIPNSVFLPKPFSLNELTATVQEQMRRQGDSGKSGRDPVATSGSSN